MFYKQITFLKDKQTGFNESRKAEEHLDQHVFYKLTYPLEEICLYQFRSAAAVLCARAGCILLVDK